jgi:hypothetical protein
MLWVHGGGLQEGNGYLGDDGGPGGYYDGSNLVKEFGVVVVSIQYDDFETYRHHFPICPLVEVCGISCYACDTRIALLGERHPRVRGFRSVCFFDIVCLQVSARHVRFPGAARLSEQRYTARGIQGNGIREFWTERSAVRDGMGPA